MMRPALALLALAPLALLAGAASATPALPTGFARLQAQNQLLQDIGWRLAQGNAPYCDTVRLAVGLQLQDMRSYSAPDTVRHLLGLTGDFAIASAARGSPADQDGMLANQEILAIAGQRLSAWPAEARLDWRRQAQAHDTIDRALADGGSVSLTTAGGHTVELRGLPTCATRFEMTSDGDQAVAEGQRVIIGSAFPGFAYPEDELAAAIAHETAHNWLNHRSWLNAQGRKQKNIRLTEREADRLMPWLLANAGYDPDAALRFMQRWGPRHDGGFLRKRTHDGWDERAHMIASEVGQVKEQLARSGVANWREQFRRDIGPVPGNPE